MTDAFITQAFTAVFSTYKDKLYYFILKMTGDSLAARDILQDVFLRLWEKRMTIDWGQSDVQPLLFTCVRHLIIDHARKNHRRLELMQELAADNAGQAESPAVLQSVDETDRRSQVEDFLSLLPEKRVKIFRMVKEEDLSHKEVAEKLGLSLSDVKKQVSLSLRGLRKEIQS